MSKQDRQGVRTAVDLERKYSFGQTFAQQGAQISRLEQDMNQNISELEQSISNLPELEQTATELTKTVSALSKSVSEIEKSVEDLADLRGSLIVSIEIAEV